MVIVALSVALLRAVLITVIIILIPAVIASMLSMVPPAHNICIFNLSDVLEWFQTCLTPQCCSRIMDCKPGNAFSFLLFVVIFTAEQLSSLDDNWQVIGRVNLV